MNYEIKVKSETGTIHVKINCVLDQEMRARIILGVLNQMSLAGSRKIMVDVTEAAIDDSEPMSNMHDVLDYMMKLGLSPDMRIAFVYSNSETHRMYFQTISHMEGYAIRYFKDIEEASKWMESPV